jgi:hypothetical protein
MAEPVKRGTIISRPFINENVKIIHEDLRIKIDSTFSTARFEITYHIYASKDGIRIPFLFYAADLKQDFTIYLDGTKIEVTEIPDIYGSPDGTKFSDFSYYFSNESGDRDKLQTQLEEDPGYSFYVDLNDLIYFETDISEGEHTISVSYTAGNWIDGSDWVNEYSFRYALSPAKYWKSFGSLSITIDANDFTEEIETNLGFPARGEINSLATWDFDYLPKDLLMVVYKPGVSNIAAILIRTGSAKLAYIIGSLVVLIHLTFIYRARKRKPGKWVVIIGGILVPLIFIFFWIGSYTIIDNIIGEHASREHGYAGIQILLYPIIMPAYWIITWLIDRLLKRNMVSKSFRHHS